MRISIAETKFETFIIRLIDEDDAAPNIAMDLLNGQMSLYHFDDYGTASFYARKFAEATSGEKIQEVIGSISKEYFILI